MFPTCILCGKVGSGACPRCGKPLCERHATKTVDAKGKILYEPSEYCRVPNPWASAQQELRTEATRDYWMSGG